MKCLSCLSGVLCPVEQDRCGVRKNWRPEVFPDSCCIVKNEEMTEIVNLLIDCPMML